jgi:hypothetical protein
MSSYFKKKLFACFTTINVIESNLKINLQVSIVLSVIFCVWVTTSRLYLGMHSLLVLFTFVFNGNESLLHWWVGTLYFDATSL